GHEPDRPEPDQCQGAATAPQDGPEHLGPEDLPPGQRGCDQTEPGVARPLPVDALGGGPEEELDVDPGPERREQPQGDVELQAGLPRCRAAGRLDQLVAENP